DPFPQHEDLPEGQTGPFDVGGRKVWLLGHDHPEWPGVPFVPSAPGEPPAPATIADHRRRADPVHRLKIDSLAAPLQAAELARDPGAATDPWYDGCRPEHGHTLVAAPRGKTKLSDRMVLAVVKRWARARSARRPWPFREVAIGVVAAAALLLLVLIY